MVWTMYRQLYVEWIFVHQNEHGFTKKKKEIHVLCPERTKMSSTKI